MRFIGLDIHRDFCEVAICLPGERARSAGRIATEPEKLRLFAESLDRGDRVVMESTGNALAIARVLEGHSRRSRSRTPCRYARSATRRSRTTATMRARWQTLPGWRAADGVAGR